MIRAIQTQKQNHLSGMLYPAFMTTCLLLLTHIPEPDEAAVVRNLSIRKSAKSVIPLPSRQLLNKPEMQNSGRSHMLNMSTADKFVHELKAWALKALKRQHREYFRSEMRTILRNTDRGYVAISPAKVTCMLLTTIVVNKYQITPIQTVQQR